MLKKLHFKSWLLMLCMLLGVTNVMAADKWVKTAITDLTSGDVVAIVDETSSKALFNGNAASSAPTAIAVTLSSDKTEITGEVVATLKWEVTVLNDGYQFMLPGSSDYLYCTNTNNGVRVGTNSNNVFTIYDNEGVGFLLNSATNRYIGVYNNQDWRCYTSINNNIKDTKLAFYKFVADQTDTRTEVSLSFSPTAVLAKIGEAFNAPTLTVNPTDAIDEVVFSSDNTDVATVNNDGSVTIVGAGSANITASIDENSTSYKGESKSYIIGVVAHAGTQGDPYTIIDARAAIDANTGVTGVYATGIVSEIVTAYNSQYGNISYNISSDGTTTADQLQAYRGKSYNGDNFTSADDIQVGDEVVIYGNLKKHNSTYEFDANNQLVSLNRPTSAVEKPEFSPAGGNFKEAQSVTITCATDGATIYYTLDGTEPTASSTQYTAPIQVSSTTTIKAIAVKGSDVSTVAEATYTILVLKTIAEARAQETGNVETKGVVTSINKNNVYIQDATAAILVYGSSNITDLAVGDEIKVSGELTTYNGLLEIKNPTYTVVSQNNTVNPTVMTIAEVNASDAPQSWLVRIEEASVTAIDGQNVTLAQGEETVVVRFNAASDVTISVNDVVSLTGNIGCYNTVQIANPTNIEVQENTDPVISAEDVTLAYNATSGEIAYTISNVDEGTELDDATPNADWISGITIASDKVTFTTTANEGTEDRKATITLTYGDVTKDVTVTQGHYVAPVIDYATLPFAFDGGKADIANTVGLSQDGLDSDYGSSPKLKFNSTDDVVILHFNEQPGTLSFDIKGNSFSGGSFTVQTSVDGVTYTNLKSYTSLTSTVQSEIFEDLEADVRYIKWVFTKKSSGNVALGNITLAKYTVKQDATVSFKKDGEEITSLTANLYDEVEVTVECSVEGADLSITSSNTRVAKYEEGVVKALAEGEATITATFAGNDEYKSATATLAVTVVDSRETVTLAFNDVPAEININETATYAVTTTPVVEGITITYSSSAPTVVSVDEATGEIEALAVGSATITATFAGDSNYKAATATYTITVVNPSFVASKYELVTDASTLVAGDEIIIVGVDGDNAYALSITQNNNNRAATSVTIASDGTISSTAEVAIITLGGEADAWTFYVTNGATTGYLYAAGGSSSNYLRTQDDPASASVVITEAGEATIAFNGVGRNIMRFNPNTSNNNPLFACYASTSETGSLVSIYRKVADQPQPYKKGDVNNDKQVSIADVTALVNIILGKATPETNPEYNFEAANVNEDDTVSIADVTALVNIILGKDQ